MKGLLMPVHKITYKDLKKYIDTMSEDILNQKVRILGKNYEHADCIKIGTGNELGFEHKNEFYSGVFISINENLEEWRTPIY